MRIAMVYSTGFPPREGMGKHVCNVAAELAHMGHEVRLFTRGSKRNSITNENGLSVEVLPNMPLYPFHVDIQGIWIKKMLVRTGWMPDIIDAHTPNPPPIRIGAPLVTTFHAPMKVGARVSAHELLNPITIATKILAGFTVLNEYRLLGASTALAAVSRNVAEELEVYGVLSDRVSVLGNGVDSSLFSPQNAQRDESATPYVLFVGRLAYRKGLFELLSAMLIATKKIPQLALRIAGDGPLERRLRDVADRLGLADAIEFMGFVPENRLASLYSNAVATVIPSAYESGPLVLLEALACGCPFIAAPVGLVPEVMEQVECGIVINEARPEHIAAAVERLVEEGSLRDRLGVAGRELVLREYTWKAVAARTQDFCEKAVGKWSPS